MANSLLLCTSVLPSFCVDTQRSVSISSWIIIEAKKDHKAGERSSCSAMLSQVTYSISIGELHVHGLIDLCQTKMYEIFGLFGQIYINKNFPSIWYHIHGERERERERTD